MTSSFAERVPRYTRRIAQCLEQTLPTENCEPQRLHAAMRYAVLNGGKRIRPLLCYASAECLDVKPETVDAAATAIELLHAFSLVHDDLPAMDDDDLRRGKPTVHRKFDEATAILAADALQPLAFSVIANCPVLDEPQALGLVQLVASACGSLGMTGGQAMDLSSEGRVLSAPEIEQMYRLKTGALIYASVMSAARVAPELSQKQREALDTFAISIGLAFQIRDDLLDVTGETRVIGKPAGSDERRKKATYPSLLGIDAAEQRCNELLQQGLDCLDDLQTDTEPLRWVARYIVERTK